MTYPRCWIRRRHEGGVMEPGWRGPAWGPVLKARTCVECGVTLEHQFGIEMADQWTGNPRAWEWVWHVEVEEVRR